MSNHDTRYSVIAVTAVLILGLIALVIITACSDPTLEDLPNNRQRITQTDVTVYQMPDQFPNIVFFCNGPTGVYVNTRQANSTNLNPNDPKCAG